MNLYCQETGRKLAVETGFFVIQRPSDNSFVVVDPAAFADIPSDARRGKDCEELGDLDGVDVHKGTAAPSGDGGFLTRDIRTQGFCFSLDRETVARMLSETDDRFPKRAYLARRNTEKRKIA